MRIRWRLWLGIAIAAAVAVCVAYAVLVHIVASEFASTWDVGTQIGGYASALEYYHDIGKPVPNSLQEIVDTYQAAGLMGEQPSTVPEYRPAGHLKGGPYLVLVGPPLPPHGKRHLVWAYPDGKIARNWIFTEKQYQKALADDERQRAVQSSESPSVW